jgi:hypothetical protein
VYTLSKVNVLPKRIEKIFDLMVSLKEKPEYQKGFTAEDLAKLLNKTESRMREIGNILYALEYVDKHIEEKMIYYKVKEPPTL